MNSELDNRENIYCADDDEYRMYCGLCDELCIERFFNDRLKSGTHITKNRKREQSK